MFVHTAGFVHKGIRPGTILVFDQDSAIIDPKFPSTCSSFLVGFERFRRAEAQTECLGDLEWERNLYLHPVRQGLWSEEAFIMQHDIIQTWVVTLGV
jgi:hypothetical protein